MQEQQVITNINALVDGLCKMANSSRGKLDQLQEYFQVLHSVPNQWIKLEGWYYYTQFRDLIDKKIFDEFESIQATL
jgi:hypothetical protein